MLDDADRTYYRIGNVLKLFVWVNRKIQYSLPGLYFAFATCVLRWTLLLCMYVYMLYVVQ